MAKILCFSHSVNPDEDMEPQPEKDLRTRQWNDTPTPK